jgi:5-(carboxyamino)imidazole ribonucleotide synthase
VAGASDRTVADEARDIAVRVAEGVGVTGMLAVELFETRDGRVLVNELAMRPHNSGHWSIDGAVTSQFEQHLRAVLDLPLGSTRPREDWSVMINVLGGPVGQLMQDRYDAVAAQFPEAKLHSYAKESRPGRKVGHVTVTGAQLEGVLADARAAAAFFE